MKGFRLQFVLSTPIALVAVIVLAILGVSRGAWVFFALTPFGAAAALNLPALSGASIGVADLGAVTLIVLVLLSRDSASSIAGTLKPWQPGAFFTGVVIVSIIGVMFAPRFFAGATEVFGIARDNTRDVIVRYPLGPSTGNITQLFRLMLGFFVFVAFATAFRRNPNAHSVIVAMIVATVVNFVLGLLDLITGATGTAFLMEPLRTANYSMHITDTMAGIKRMVGGFPEASSFGFFSLGLFGFWLQYWISAHRSKAAVWMLALSAFMVVRSTSSAAYLALVVFLFGFAVFNVFRYLRPQVERRSATLTVAGTMLFWLATIAITASYQFVDPVTVYLDDTLFNKMNTDSGVERMSWNTQALLNFRETWWIGAGLGSVRASNWLIACLGSIGILGTLLFIGFMTSLALMPSGPSGNEHGSAIRGLKAGCAAMLSVAVLTHATPDLGVFFFALAGVATGLSRGWVGDPSGSRQRNRANNVARA